MKIADLIIWPVLTIGILLVVAYSIKRDIQYEKEYSGDLRNRVVGARLVKDGRSPYFYKWKAGDGLRYYDPENFNHYTLSNITSTPMFDHLLSPLVEWPEATISRIWLGIEYGILIAIGAFSVIRAPTGRGKQAVILVIGLFLLSNAWKSHITMGQSYLCVPFFAMLFLVFLEKDGPPWKAVLAGIAASCLVLIRPNTALFFVPFFFIGYRYPRHWLQWFGIPMVACLFWIFASSRERGLWQDYYRFVSLAVQSQQTVYPEDAPDNAPDPRYPLWEGIDTAVYHYYQAHRPAPVYSENGNFSVIYRAFFHRPMTTRMNTTLSFLLIALFVLLFYFRTRPLNNPDPYRAALLGCCLFMIPDLFSPVYRHQYYTVQWILPLALAAGHINPRQKVYYGLLLLALLLNCFHLPFLKMQNTIGEYLFLVVLFLMAADPDPVNKKISS